MSRRRSTVRSTGRMDPARVGAIATRAGFVVAAVALPLVVGSAAGVLSGGGTVSTVAAAVDGPLLHGSGPAWLFRIAATGLVGGCWLLGAGFLLEGLFD